MELKGPRMSSVNHVEEKASNLITRVLAVGIVLLAVSRHATAGQQPAAQTTAGGIAYAEVDENDAWVFNPPEDKFTDDAVIDLRYLNEKVAGETGFVGLSKDGMSFVKGDGTPIRFWSAVDNGWRMKPEDMDRHLRWLAKLGVNMVRVHAQLCKSKEGDKITDVDEEQIAGILRYVASAKKLGIYVTISPFWAFIDKIPESWQIPGYTGQRGPTNLLFFDKRMQEGYKAWVRELYTRPNPHTGVALKDEPAVAIIQVQNEDSLLFWTFSTLREPLAGDLRRMFGEWLKVKYGSLAKVKAIWKDEKHEKDNFDNNEVGLYAIWDFTGQAPKPGEAKQRRMAEQLNFIGELQYKFYKDIGEYYHKELGCKQLTNATNWRTADPVLLEDVERWTYTANEVSAINRYTGGVHSGEHNGYRVDPGHLFVSQSNLKAPEEFPGALKQTVGQPMIITEAAWVHPTLYQSEGPFLMAAYHSMTGVDSLYWFAYDDVTWTLDPVWPWWKGKDNKNSLKKWYGSYPMQAGMFPATAIAYRLGYIKTAEAPVVYEERDLRSLWYRRVPIISEAGKFDVNRDEGDFAAASAIKQEVDRLAFMVGPVYVKFGGSERNSRVAQLSKHIDRGKGVVKAVTGEIELNYKVGICAVNAPKFQGVVGFLKDGGGTFKLNDVTIESGNDYATIIVTAMDDKPIAESGRVLVQVGTVCRTTGWLVRDTEFKAEGGTTLKGKEIIDTGKPPWRIANTKATITIRNSKLTRATLLNESGYAASDVPVTREQGAMRVGLPANALYVVLQ